MVLLGLNQAATVMSGLHLAPGDYVMYTLATMAVAPNAVLFGQRLPARARLRGRHRHDRLAQRGLARAGAGVPAAGRAARATVRRPSGPSGCWRCRWSSAMVGAVLAQRAYRVTAYDSAALRGFGCGFGAALLSTAAIAVAGGPMGTGRMADIGAPLGEVLVSAVAAMSLGGLVAGVVTAWWQRRAVARADHPADRPRDRAVD